MPQSLVKNYLHITFSTKGRKPLIDKFIQAKLYGYIARICNNMECFALEVGGVQNHVHILCLLSKKVTLIKLLEAIKKNASKWMKKQGQQYHNFYWQIGYGAFSVNPSELEVVKRYIQLQEEHHKKKTFQEEYLSFLSKYNVKYDERYLWD